ncbi:MAG: MBL fold metallo-hydrolase [Chloroflexota bacterium]|nr:MBL fold metallo-hydrolase [Chloroflexota bacterium]
MIYIQHIASTSRANCTYIHDKYTHLLLDCGVAPRPIQQIVQFPISNLDGVLITHQHADHCRGVRDMLWLGVSCYMLEATANYWMYSDNRLTVYIEPDKPVTIGTWTVTPFPAIHDVPCVGYCLDSEKGGRAVYLTDSAYSPRKFPGMTHLMVECNYDVGHARQNVKDGVIDSSVRDRVISTHMSIDTLCQLLEANDTSQLQEIRLMHLSDNNSQEDEFVKRIRGITGLPVKVAE